MTAITGTAIVQAAYEDAGKLAEGATASTAQNTRGLARLVDLINFEATQGLKLWLQTEVSVTLVAGTRTYNVTTAAGRPLQFLFAYLLASDGTTKTPVTPCSREEYTRLAQLTTQGTVNQLFVDKQYNQFVVSLFNVPDATQATSTLKLVLRVHATTPVVITDTLLFPDEWAMFLRWALADELATGAPQAVQQRIQQRAERYREALESFDVEDTPTRFELSGYGQESRFR